MRSRSTDRERPLADDRRRQYRRARALSTFSLWNKYQITPEFGIGLGVITQTHAYASSDNTVRLPGFTRFDAALFYKFSENLRAQINVENLFDRHYATAHSNDNIMPGSPRAVRFAVIATF